MLSRRGSSLTELVVALTLGGLVLSVATASLLRTQRLHAGYGASHRAREQLRTATAILSAQANLHDAADVDPSAARDTAIQLRSAIAAGISCDSAATVSFATGVDDLAAGGVVSLPRAGDSLWWYGAPPPGWAGGAVAAAWLEVADCPASATPHGTRVPVVRVRRAGGDTVPLPARTPLRITRGERLVLYRAGDGSWQLGLREWSNDLGAFASPQPVAGPFQRAAVPGSRSGFRYFDSLGGELHPGDVPPAAGVLRRARLTVVTPPSPGSTTTVRESLDVAFRAAGAP